MAERGGFEYSLSLYLLILVYTCMSVFARVTRLCDASIPCGRTDMKCATISAFEKNLPQMCHTLTDLDNSIKIIMLTVQRSLALFCPKRAAVLDHDCPLFAFVYSSSGLYAVGISLFSTITA